MKKYFLSPVISLVIGTAIWLFLSSLSQTIEFFQSHWSLLIWMLPVIAGLYFSLEPRLNQLSNVWKAPVHFISNLYFQLFGASVGRESTAVQMGGDLVQWISDIFRIEESQRPTLIRMGFSAGFGAAFGVPWAGAFFAVESYPLQQKGQWQWRHFPLYLFCSWGADKWAGFLGVTHLPLPTVSIESLSKEFLLLAGLLIALALSYELIFQKTHKALAPWRPWVRASAGGLTVLFLTLAMGGWTFNNLGTNLILNSFFQPAALLTSGVKLLFTWVSTVTGMKGGEVTPLMAAGALFGSFFSNWLQLAPFQLGAALGMVSLFTSRLRIPLTGAIMLWELFDWKIALLGAPILLAIEIGQRKLVSKLS